MSKNNTGHVKRVPKPDKSPFKGQSNQLKRGWTTGACATAATKAALTALISGEFPDPVSITLPKGETPAFPLCFEKLEKNYAQVGIVKDAGDDPDVTHGATIISRVTKGKQGSGIVFKGGDGVGTVTKAGLPVAIGEPAINPIPRKLMTNEVQALCQANNIEADFEITISVPDGNEMAKHTWNPRLGILGGISILGTTGIVHPFSCSAWINSIHSGIDVSRASGLTHVLAATGSTSEKAAQDIYAFSDEAMLDMGDFVGGLLKYLRKNPIENITLAGGFGKFTKLAKGALDLHSGRSQVDLNWLAELSLRLGLGKKDVEKIKSANTALEALQIAEGEIPLAAQIANLAHIQAVKTLNNTDINVEVMIFDRSGKMLARVGKINV